MANTFQVDVVSAEKDIYSGQVAMLIASAKMGEVGITPGHAPFISQIKPGEIRVKLENGEEESFFVSGGMLEVQPKLVTVLADTAIRAADIDEAAAVKAKELAEAAAKDASDAVDFAQAQKELAEAVAQLQLIRKFRKK